MDLIGAMDFFSSPDGIICLIAGAVVGLLITQLLRWGIGLVGNIIIGAIGGVIGGYIFDVINIIDVGDLADPIIASAIGAVLFIGISNLFRR